MKLPQTLSPGCSRQVVQGVVPKDGILVPKDPREALRDWSPKVQQAVKAGRIMKGMNRKQVLMSLGWPTTGSTPNIDDPVWNYPAGFKVIFNERWAVKAIDADDAVKKQVVMP